MEKQTLQFQCLFDMARFSKQLEAGYLMNTNRFTLTGHFKEEDIQLATTKFKAKLIETTEKIYGY
ncbi:MAG TPA: hypothetical protein VFR58_14565 [Flavisolibacter sp.]|nr:hypothetical protein [Flavisolibacter sp.]